MGLPALSMWFSWRKDRIAVTPSLRLVHPARDAVTEAPKLDTDGVIDGDGVIDVQSDAHSRDGDDVTDAIDGSGRGMVTRFLGWVAKRGEAGWQTATRAWCLYNEFCDYVGAEALERREFWRQLATHCPKSRQKIVIDGEIRRPVLYQLPRVA